MCQASVLASAGFLFPGVASAAAFVFTCPSPSVCVFVQISLTLLQYDLISTSCVCYNPIPKEAHPLSYWRLGLQHRSLGAMIQPLTPYNNTNIKL